MLGALMGVVWAPCAGPILGSIIILASSSGSVVTGGLLLLTYSIGAGIPMLAIAYGGHRALAGRRFVQERSESLRKAFGIILILTAVLLATGTLREIEAFLAPYAPIWSSQL